MSVMANPLGIESMTDSSKKSAGPLFDAEPVSKQIARRFRVTVALTAMPALIGSIILAIFTGFGRPEVGLGLITILLLPVVVMAWVEYGLYRSRVRSFLANPLTDDKNDAPPV